MLDLASLQSAMTQALFTGSLADIEGELDASHANPARRFAIYRNNMFLSLTAHLRTVFPVTAKLGDDRFFSYAAHQFILREPPRSSRLVVYSETFPGFLARFPACRHTPILAQMAALEWAIHKALTSAQMPFLEPADIEDLSGAMTLELQPSLHFVLSRWPLLGLWAHEAERQRPLLRKTSRLAVLRHDDDIRFFELDPARFAFWRSLARQRPIEVAAARALARDPRFNLVDEILFLFRNRLVTETDKGSLQ
jgi:hypothetical protein